MISKKKKKHSCFHFQFASVFSSISFPISRANRTQLASIGCEKMLRNFVFLRDRLLELRWENLHDRNWRTGVEKQKLELDNVRDDQSAKLMSIFRY
jgi:hypothetical protein